MVSQADLIMIAIAFAIGYIDDITGPQPHHHKGTVVIVDKKYQCPTYCGVNHHHSVYFKDQSNGMVVEKSELGKRYKPPKKKK